MQGVNAGALADLITTNDCVNGGQAEPVQKSPEKLKLQVMLPKGRSGNLKGRGLPPAFVVKLETAFLFRIKTENIPKRYFG